LGINTCTEPEAKGNPEARGWSDIISGEHSVYRKILGLRTDIEILAIRVFLHVSQEKNPGIVCVLGWNTSGICMITSRSSNARQYRTFAPTPFNDLQRSFGPRSISFRRGNFRVEYDELVRSSSRKWRCTHASDDNEEHE